MAYVTFNADDFGMTQGVTAGISQAIERGIVTSTSAMVCVKDAENNVGKFAPGLSGTIGTHLQLTEGRPVLSPVEVPSLVTAEGNFYHKSKDLPWHIDPDELLHEWRAQIYRLQSWGIQPTYLDTHHQVHLQSHILPVIAKLASEMDLPVRAGTRSTCRQLRYLGVSCADFTISNFYGDGISWERLLILMRETLKIYGSEAVIEVCCHPGISSEKLEKMSGYNYGREKELEILTVQDGKRKLQDIGFNLIGMNEVKKLRPSKPLKTFEI